VNIGEPTSGDPTGLSDVLIGALGLSGALILVAVVLAAAFAALLFWRRSRVGLEVDLDEARNQRLR
jgi:hypothetical protein